MDTFTYKTKKELQSKTQSETFTQTDLKWLPELNPPAFMPQGNVGTPLSVFLELIRTCRLPPRVIKKLQLNFPKTGSSRRYGNVPFKYQDTETFAQELVYTAAGDEITEESEPVISSGVSDQTHDDDDDGIGERSGKEKSEESHSDDVSRFLLSHCWISQACEQQGKSPAAFWGVCLKGCSVPSRFTRFKPYACSTFAAA